MGDNFKTYNPFNWTERFSDAQKFDIVIDNPPYIMELRDNKETFRPLQLIPLGQKYYEPKMDIFYFFIELGIDLLKPNGYLGFIVQQYWTSRTHASKLRWHAPTKDTTSYVRVKDSLASGAGGR